MTTFDDDAPSIVFEVSGIAPRPAGSKNAFPFRRHDGRLGVRVTDSSGLRGKAWRDSVAKACILAMKKGRKKLLHGAVKLRVAFRLPRPMAHYTGKAKTLRDGAPPVHVQKPDTTKLLRAVEDALTGIAWGDDAQIVWQEASKEWADPGSEGATVYIVELT